MDLPAAGLHHQFLNSQLPASASNPRSSFQLQHQQFSTPFVYGDLCAQAEQQRHRMCPAIQSKYPTLHKTIRTPHDQVHLIKQRRRTWAAGSSLSISRRKVTSLFTSQPWPPVHVQVQVHFTFPRTASASPDTVTVFNQRQEEPPMNPS